jgi:predicted alpha/beta superfamily hydrolase
VAFKNRYYAKTFFPSQEVLDAMEFPTRTVTLVGGMVLALIASGYALQTTESQSPDVTLVTVPGTEVIALTSSATGRDYDIYIRFPAEFSRAGDKQYPVLYVLDGQWDFKLLDSIYGGLYYDGFVPEMIIVGITYSGADADYDALRAMDYTPASSPSVRGSGDAPKFLAFLKEELFPLIEANYPTDTAQRVLMGSSYGGLFTLYAMFTEPELFSGYVSASPAVPFAGAYAFNQEAEYASQHDALPARLYLSVGELEPLAPPVVTFMKTLHDRNYEGFKMGARIIDGERHAGNKPEAFNRGLRYVFQDD